MKISVWKISRHADSRPFHTHIKTAGIMKRVLLIIRRFCIQRTQLMAIYRGNNYIMALNTIHNTHIRSLAKQKRSLRVCAMFSNENIEIRFYFSLVFIFVALLDLLFESIFACSVVETESKSVSLSN